MMPATALNRAYAKLPARDVERARAFYADKFGPDAVRRAQRPPLLRTRRVPLHGLSEQWGRVRHP